MYVYMYVCIYYLEGPLMWRVEASSLLFEVPRYINESSLPPPVTPDMGLCVRQLRFNLNKILTTVM